MSKGLPEKIKIGYYDYSVSKSQKPLIVNSRACKGRVDYEHAIIEILDDGQTGEQSHEQTFWHEVVHAIVYDRDIELSGDEEEAVDRLAKGLYALMKDNAFPLPGQRDVSE